MNRRQRRIGGKPTKVTELFQRTLSRISEVFSPVDLEDGERIGQHMNREKYPPSPVGLCQRRDLKEQATIKEVRTKSKEEFLATGGYLFHERDHDNASTNTIPSFTRTRSESESTKKRFKKLFNPCSKCCGMCLLSCVFCVWDPETPQLHTL